jgi:hypothetical protein
MDSSSDHNDMGINSTAAYNNVPTGSVHTAWPHQGHSDVPYPSYSVVFPLSGGDVQNVVRDIRRQLPNKEEARSLVRNYFRVSSLIL